MKTYSGELKEGERYCTEDGSSYKWTYGSSYKDMSVIKLVYHDNEWQLYKPSQAKKVWGIPEEGQEYYTIEYNPMNCSYYAKHNNGLFHAYKPVYLDKHTAEQRAKAENYINEFRALSDVPVNGKLQWGILPDGKIYAYDLNVTKFLSFCVGYVANSREKIKRDLAAFPKIALANKIVTWGYHGIVEEVL